MYNSAVQSSVAALIMFANADFDEGDGSGDFIQEEFVPLMKLDHLFVEDPENRYNVCASNPCQNGAECVNTEDMQFSCDCSGNYFGKLCDQKMNPEFEWITTWPNGGQIHINLPTAMANGHKRLTIVFPSGCLLSSVEVWHACLVGPLTNITEQMIMIQQIGWDNNHDFVGVTFEALNSDAMKECLKTDNFAHALSDAESDPDECVKRIQDTTKHPTYTEPSNTAVVNINQVVEYAGIEGMLSKFGVSITVIQNEKSMNGNASEDLVTVLGLLPGESSMVQWVSRWGV